MAMPRLQVLLFVTILFPIFFSQLQGCNKGGGEKEKEKKGGGKGKEKKGGKKGGKVESWAEVIMKLEAKYNDKEAAWEAVNTLKDDGKVDAKTFPMAMDAIDCELPSAKAKDMIKAFAKTKKDFLEEDDFGDAWDAVMNWKSLVEANKEDKDGKTAAGLFKKIADTKKEFDPKDLMELGEGAPGSEDEAGKMCDAIDTDGNKAIDKGEFETMFKAVNPKGGKDKDSLLEDFRGVSYQTKTSFVSLSNPNATDDDEDEEEWDDRDFTWTRGIHGKAPNVLGSPDSLGKSPKTA